MNQWYQDLLREAIQDAKLRDEIKWINKNKSFETHLPLDIIRLISDNEASYVEQTKEWYLSCFSEYKYYKVRIYGLKKGGIVYNALELKK